MPWCQEKKYQKLSKWFRCRWIPGAPHDLGYGCSNCKECLEMNENDWKLDPQKDGYNNANRVIRMKDMHSPIPHGMGPHFRLLGMVQAMQNARNQMAKYWAAKLGAAYEEPYKVMRRIDLERNKAIVEISKILPATKMVSNMQNTNGAPDRTTGIWRIAYDVVRKP